ncbi:MAG: CHAT domain-containing protein [Candidatus Nitrotoga sp. SPKER]|nr:MAG: CHAT domain-containing protein [Candidatus Nitrotoga sp. SPKER]
MNNKIKKIAIGVLVIHFLAACASPTSDSHMVKGSNNDASIDEIYAISIPNSSGAAEHPLNSDTSVQVHPGSSSIQLVPSIVYNADLSPQLPRKKEFPNLPVLKSAQAATLRFDIGPPWTKSILTPRSPPSEILNSIEDVGLTVVFSCSFCKPHAESLKHITYQPSKRRSNEILFHFTPQHGPEGRAYIGAVQLLIINDKTGNEHDRLTVDVAIEEDGTVSTTALPTVVAGLASEPNVTSNWSPDVILYATEELNRIISFEVEPVSAELKAEIGELAFDNRGVRRKFLSGVNDTLMDAMTLSAYGAMSAVSLQGDFLRRLSSTGIDAKVSEKSLESLELTNMESANVVGAIADVGQQLYRHLFSYAQDSKLLNIIGQLEVFAAQTKDRPLRLKIVTNRVSLPWQYLHPLGPDIEPAKFWGLRFSLSVLRANTGERQRTIAKGKELARKVVFAQYGSSADPTVKLAEDQMNQLRQIMSPSNLIVVNSGADLLDKALTKQRMNISAIFTFLHASSGAMQPANSLEPLGPQLSFNDNDIVTSTKLENLLNRLTQENVPYLAGAPLVILNACETGPSTNLPHVSLENAMFQLGAQGVVVTEVSVWLRLGHEVATRLIAKLGKGEIISDALTAVRRELYVEKNNPLGLLYGYYGDPAATLRH